MRHFQFTFSLFFIFYCISIIVKHTRAYFYELDFKLFDVTCLNKVLYCTVLYLHSALYCIALRCVALCCVVLCCIVLYCIVL